MWLIWMERQTGACTFPERKRIPISTIQSVQFNSSVLGKMKSKVQGSLFTGYTSSLVELNQWSEDHTQSSFWLKCCSGRNLLPWSLPHSLQGLPKTAKQSHLVNTLPSHTSLSLSPCMLHFGTCNPLDLSAWKMWLCCKFSLWFIALNRKAAGI